MKTIRKTDLLVNMFHGLLLLDDDLHAKLEDFMEELGEHMEEYHKLKELEELNEETDIGKLRNEVYKLRNQNNELMKRLKLR